MKKTKDFFHAILRDLKRGGNAFLFQKEIIRKEKSPKKVN